MYLGNPLLPINESPLTAEQIVRKQMEKKNWLEFEVKPLTLELVPFFLFNYHYYLENTGDGKKTIKSSVHGILAVDGHAIKIRDDLVELLKNNWKKAIPEVPRGNFDQKWCNIDKREQDEVLKIQTAKFFDVPKENVVVSQARKLLLPWYRTEVIVDKKKYPLIIIAVDGSVHGVKNIPQREKGYLEITRETVSELKKPSNWINYSKEAFSDLFSASKENKKAQGNKEKNSIISSIDFGFLESKLFLLILMLLAVLLIIASIFRIKF